MPRKPRFYMPGVPVHVVQRGNNRNPIFFNDSDYQSYLDWLKEGSESCQCDIHAYVLMSNHVHILVTPKDKDSIGRMMQFVGRRYVPYINKEHNRSGTLWEGRYKASLVQDEEYLFACMCYIELNPVRARMVKTAAAYRWSSYSCNASGRKSDIIKAHKLYLGLGNNEIERRSAYKDLFRYHMEDETVREIRAAWHTGTPLGNARFKEKIEKRLKIKVGYAKRGRPKGE